MPNEISAKAPLADDRMTSGQSDQSWPTPSWASDRWDQVKRDYTLADVRRLSGSLTISQTLADRGAASLWRLLHEQDFVPTLGAFTGNQAVQHVRAGLKATHMVLSFDLSRPRDDRAAHRAVGRVRFDDIRLFARREPFPLRHRELDDGAGDPHALKLSASLGHSARGGASEVRYALAAPAPSTLRFTSRIPRSELPYATLHRRTL